MFDQLLACMTSKRLPGYFIQECNLMDCVESPHVLFWEIEKMRSNPIAYAATFINSTRCFRYSNSIISKHIPELCKIYLIEEMVLQRQLICLQKMMIEMDLTRGITFWKKEIVLRIFAKWCKQNCPAIHLTPWQSLTTNMSLFDVVYLDIVHEFDVPNDVLLGYVDREWSVEVVCKLAVCYSLKVLKCQDHENNTEYSLNFKTLLMIHRALNYKYATFEAIIITVSILIRCKEYEIAAQVLDSATWERSSEEMILRFAEFYADIVSHKTKNEIQEISEIVQNTDIISSKLFHSIPFVICFLSMCATKTYMIKKRSRLCWFILLTFISLYHV